MNPLFTARQIADALGRSKWGALKALQDSSPGVISGRGTRGWPLSVVPPTLRLELQLEAERRGLTIETLLANPLRAWEPPIPWNEVAPDAQERATKLQRALTGSVARQDTCKTAAEFEQLGCEDYERVMGYSISTRYFRELWRRTQDRARDGNFSRLEIYLEKNPPRRRPERTFIAVDVERELGELHYHMRAFADPKAPSAPEKELFWEKVFERFEDILMHGQKATRTKRALLEFLNRHAPWLAKNPKTLQELFRIKYAKWVESGRQIAALTDKRLARRGEPTAPAFAQPDLDRIVAHTAFNCGGRRSQGVREMAEAGTEAGLSPAMTEYLMRAPANKSHVPHRLRNAITPEVKMLEPYAIGPREANLRGAWIDRDWNRVPSMKAMQADDFTMPVYWYVQTRSGFELVRGQCLIVIDLRSRRVLGFSLQPDRNYNARVIRSLQTRVFDKYGLPQILYFERGIWKSSKLITGRRGALDDADLPHSWAECERGLRAFGIRFIHAKTPRAKPIERVGGMLQDMMHGEMGYCGRDERRDKPEHIKRQEAEVRAGKAHPSKYFYSFEQWEDRMAEICHIYNSRAQHGKGCLGLSPDEAFERFKNRSDPPMRFDASCRYLLANHTVPVRVTTNGIRLCYGKQTYRYANEQLGHFVHQTVLAWLDVENPEVLVVTDMNRRNAFYVERRQSVDAIDPDPEIFEAELAQIAAHQSYGRVRYRILKPLAKQIFRGNVVHRNTVALGQEIERNKSAIVTAQRRQAAIAGKVRRKAEQIGVPVGMSAGNPTEQNLEGLKLIEEALREHERDKQSGGEQ